ncbi:VOC family protein [Kineococcus terrestris]|uniref:VOC family protein n=1 Tax=Kineococcus terrestris TaxID=2044856 RepID=UPI0034DB416E
MGPGAPSSRLVQVVVDARDPWALAGWWRRALDWRPGYSDDHEADVDPPEGEPGVGLVFVPVDPPSAGRQRLHLDLDTSSVAEQRLVVAELLDLGARRLDVGQGEVPWEVLADPEGNAFCVLDPRPEYDGSGRVAALVAEARDPHSLAAFWRAASGWEPVRTSDDVVALRRGDTGPHLELVRSPHPHAGKNRWHLDLRPVRAAGRDAALRELLARGARHADVGQGQVAWDVLADPEGNEFCLLAGPVD